MSNGEPSSESVYGIEITIGLVTMLLVKRFFVESLIVEADVFSGLSKRF